MNVCLFRWKQGGQIVAPSSFCPHCKTPIKWFDNIPIISFAILGGRCRSCKTRISWQYPIVEALTAFLFWVITFIPVHIDPLSRSANLVYLSFLILLAVSDLKWRILPHSFNNLFIVAGLFFSALISFPKFIELFNVVCAFTLVGSAPFLLAQYFPKGLGGGDIKMLAALAIWDGTLNTFFLLVFANLLALIGFFCLLVTKRVDWGWKIPFGFFLSLAAFVFSVKPGLYDLLRNSL